MVWSIIGVVVCIVVVIAMIVAMGLAGSWIVFSRKCSSCGAFVSGSAKFCSKCGKPVEIP
jgi:predicted amidophosphoribosyltransferase